jgi:hypothetical protein
MDDVADTSRSLPRSAPITLGLGLALIAAGWPLNWMLEGNRTQWLFFPLWLGYVLAVDGIVQIRTGSSILRRAPRVFVALFPLSVPTWWLFEAFNERLYLGDETFGRLEYFLYCSLSFSTVVPAIFESAELIRSFPFVERFARGPVFPKQGATRSYRWTLAMAGAAMLMAMLVWPRLCYPFVWTSIVFLLEPLCLAWGRRSFTEDLLRGDWRNWMSLWIGSLVCGFFWEMWNLHSYPKWIYHVPGVGFAKVFEMPVLGYLGYLPFAMELYLVANLVLPRGAGVPLPDSRR